MLPKDLCLKITKNIEKIIIGKTEYIEIILASLIAGGHVLLDDVPGTGKTTLAKALAKSIDADFKRIQFTPDLLPSDLTGINLFNPKNNDFMFRKGALFTNLLLADEINRATPRTQSALLEAMEEKSITLDGQTYTLEAPYFVIATQNPVEAIGTFPLPEAQLDRFMVRLSLGYPTYQESLDMLCGNYNTEVLQAVTSKDEIIECMKMTDKIFVHQDIIKYIADIAYETRQHNRISLGVSSRGMINLLKLSKSYALIKGMDIVTPEIVKKLAVYALPHRILLKSKTNPTEEIEIIKTILEQITVPTENFNS